MRVASSLPRKIVAEKTLLHQRISVQECFYKRESKKVYAFRYSQSVAERIGWLKVTFSAGAVNASPVRRFVKM